MSLKLFATGFITACLAMGLQGEEEVPIGLKALLKAYPESFKAGENHSLIWPDGTEMQFDGLKREKEVSHTELLNTASLAEQMAQTYPVGPGSFDPPAKNFEPGRIRHEAFFRKMYGNSEKEVRKTLRTIVWLPETNPQKLTVTTVNGIDKKLEAVSAEIEKLPAKLRHFATPSAGTYNWRVISGTKRLSVHSFGAAIDLNVKESTYWKWDNEMKYKNRIPKEIVMIFEKHGFIWGGKWYHYDTMHFEYRPELLLLAKIIPAKEKPGAEE